VFVLVAVFVIIAVVKYYCGCGCGCLRKKKGKTKPKIFVSLEEGDASLRHELPGTKQVTFGPEGE
jgi:hypothetical protein